jgi:hypothetical protein
MMSKQAGLPRPTFLGVMPRKSDLLQRRSRTQFVRLGSIAMDCLVPAAADDEKSVHRLLPKSVFVARR